MSTNSPWFRTQNGHFVDISWFRWHNLYSDAKWQFGRKIIDQMKWVLDFIHEPLLFSLLFGFKIKSILDSQCGSEYFCKKLILPAGCINEHSTNTQDYNWILAPSILAFILSIAGKIEEAQIKLRIQPFRSREGFRQFMDVPWENSGDKFKIDSGWYVTFASSAAP